MDGHEIGNAPLIAVAGLAVVRALRARRSSLERRGNQDRRLAGPWRRQYAEDREAAIWHHAHDMPAEALRRYGALLQESPNDPVALTNAAQIWIDHGVSLQDAARALDLAAAVPAEPSRRARVVIQRARLHLSFGRYSEAAAELTALVTALREPGADPAPTAWYLFGVCLMEMGDEAGARRALRTVLAHRPLAVEAWIALAGLVAETDRPAARKLLEHGHVLIGPPGETPLPARRAACRLLVEAALIALDPPGDHAQARAFLDRAAWLCPESPYPPVNQAVIDEELQELGAFRRHIWAAVARISLTDRRLIAHLLSWTASSPYGNVTLAALGEARLIDDAELRRRLDAWEHRAPVGERSRAGHHYNGVVAGCGLIVAGLDPAFSVMGGPAMS
jgi:tetratricopeptide (TPR) repeat protein